MVDRSVKTAERPLVSVIIPVYNMEPFLCECLDSVIHQTYDRLEIILVDDGSTDTSGEICDRYAEVDHRITVIHKENGGLGNARNVGQDAASGKYIIFLDSDDYWENEHFLSSLAGSALGKDLILFGMKKYVERSGRLIESAAPVGDKLPEGKDGLIAYLINHGQFTASACTKMVKRELLLANDIFFREGVTSEDIEWSGKVLLRSKSAAYVDVSGYIYRQRENSITSTMTKRNILDLEENIVRSIHHAEKALRKTDRMYAVIMSYIAYQFATLLLCAHNVRGNMYPEIRKMKKYTYVLRYSGNKKVKLFNTVRRLVGFKGLYYASGLYMRLLFNRI